MTAASAVDAVVLAGGRGTRLGGVDKPMLVVRGRTLLEHALAAVTTATTTVVVGPERGALPAGVLRTCEDPPFGGPVAALAAGLEALLASRASAPLVVVVASDLPAAEAAVTAVLEGVSASDDVDGWVARDPEGRRQPLLAVYRVEALTRAMTALHRDRGTFAGAAVRDLVERLRLSDVPLPGVWTADVDTRDQLAEAIRASRTEGATR